MSEVTVVKQVVGITGGIASGKSNVCSVIKNEGYQIIDSDQISRDLSKKDCLIYNEIVKNFGEEYLNNDLEIDRKKLAKLIFHNNEAKEKLNKITHPIIIDEIKKQIELSSGDIIFVEIPILYEAKLEYICDKVICVFLNKKTQITRLMEREGIDEDYALEKIHSQMDLYIKKTKADYVIDSKGSFEETKNQVLEIIKRLKGV